MSKKVKDHTQKEEKVELYSENDTLDEEEVEYSDEDEYSDVEDSELDDEDLDGEYIEDDEMSVDAESDGEDLEFLSEDEIMQAGNTASLLGIRWALDLAEEEIVSNKEKDLSDVEFDDSFLNGQAKKKAEKNSEKKPSKPKMSKAKKRRIRIIAISSVAAIILAVYFGFVTYYNNHFYPGTIINGIDCNNYVPAMAEAAIKEADQVYAIEICGRNGQKAAISGNAIELHKVYDMTVEDVKKQQNAFLWFMGYMGPKEYVLDGSISFNSVLLENAIDELDFMRPENMEAPEDAYIAEFDREKGGFYIADETPGTQLDRGSVVTVVNNAILSRQGSVDLDANRCYRTATVTKEDEALNDEIARLNEITKATITYEFGDAKEVVDGGVFYNWINEKNKDINREKVTEYLTALAEKYDTYGKREDFTTLQGYKLNLPKGKFGWKLDIESETEKLIEEIKNGIKVTREPEFTVNGGAWGENDIGDYYVEIDMTNQMVYIVDHGKVLLETPCVTGNVRSGNTTPAGIFGVTYRQTNATLTGANYRSFVNYWMPFNGNIGMHDATWRGSFGGEIYKTSGSHGCVNLPKAKASQIYGMVYKGCPVVCYYLTDDYIVERPASELVIEVEEPEETATPTPTPTPAPTAVPETTPTPEVTPAPEVAPVETPVPVEVPADTLDGIPHETTPEEAAAQAAAEAAAAQAAAEAAQAAQEAANQPAPEAAQ